MQFVLYGGYARKDGPAKDENDEENRCCGIGMRVDRPVDWGFRFDVRGRYTRSWCLLTGSG